ncbi:MAG: polymorphic toxin-type HINT domain-containing protein [Dysosmobacter sp.]
MQLMQIHLEVSLKPVLKHMSRETSELVHITVNGEEIVSTHDHPYYVNKKGFINAEALWIGAELVDDNGNTLYVEQIFRKKLDDELKKVYNFKVGDYHTYLVEKIVLVHNAEYSPTEPRYGERRISDEEYDELRKQTPSRQARQKVNENK